MKLRKPPKKGKFNSKLAFEQKLERPQLLHMSREINSGFKAKFRAAIRNQEKRFPRKADTLKVKLIRKIGRFTADNLTLREISLNSKVLRVHLLQENLRDLKNNQEYKKKTPGKTVRRPSAVQSKTRTFSSDKKLKTFSSEKKHSSDKNRNPSSVKRAALQPRNSIRPLRGHPLKIKFFDQSIPRKNKMVVNNGKVIKHDPEDYFLKRLKSKPNGRIYCLKPVPYKTISEGKLNYKFHQLVNDVKNMQLPTATWKIKVIIRHNKIAAIIFTNKAQLERSLSFNSDDDKYQIVIDNKPALLLGSPGKVNSCKEIEVLLSILQGLNKNDPMILYK